MQGHESIIKMRMRGAAPSFVFVNDYPCRTDWFEHGDHATVCIFGDALDSIDFRFLVGMKVSISASTEKRAIELYRMAQESGVKTVACTDGNWTKIFHIETGEVNG